MTTLLIAEHDHETLKDVTNKALTAAKELGGDVHVLVAGGGQGTMGATSAASTPVAFKIRVTIMNFLNKFNILRSIFKP